MGLLVRLKGVAALDVGDGTVAWFSARCISGGELVYSARLYVDVDVDVGYELPRAKLFSPQGCLLRYLVSVQIIKEVRINMYAASHISKNLAILELIAGVNHK